MIILTFMNGRIWLIWYQWSMKKQNSNPYKVNNFSQKIDKINHIQYNQSCTCSTADSK